jgi:uncharacterized DUF497 family protein
MIKFEWDEEKAKANLAEHKISFEQAQLVFQIRFVSLNQTTALNTVKNVTRQLE